MSFTANRHIHVPSVTGEGRAVNGGSGPLEAVVNDGYSEREVAELLRDLLMEADGRGIELSRTPTVFSRRSFICGPRGVMVTFEDGSMFELTVQRRMGPGRP